MYSDTFLYFFHNFKLGHKNNAVRRRYLLHSISYDRFSMLLSPFVFPF